MISIRNFSAKKSPYADHYYKTDLYNILFFSMNSVLEVVRLKSKLHTNMPV